MDKFNNNFVKIPDDEEKLSLLDSLIILAKQKIWRAAKDSETIENTNRLRYLLGLKAKH